MRRGRRWVRGRGCPRRLQEGRRTEPSPLERLQSERPSAQSLGPATRSRGHTATTRRATEAQPSHRRADIPADPQHSLSAKLRTTAGLAGEAGRGVTGRHLCSLEPNSEQKLDLGRQLGQPAVSKMPPSDRAGSRLAAETPGWQRTSECPAGSATRRVPSASPGRTSLGTVPGLPHAREQLLSWGPSGRWQFSSHRGGSCGQEAPEVWSRCVHGPPPSLPPHAS